MRRLFAHAGWLVAAGLTLALVVLHRQDSPASSIASLVAGSSPDARILQPRLSGGFPWAPWRPATRGSEPGPDLRLASAIRSSLDEAAAKEATVESRHGAGVAQLLAGRPRQALATLSKVAESTNDARHWSDLSVAYYETALRYEAPELLAEALAACDRALSVAPALPEALFNRALVIETLGLRDDARAAWSRSLAGESGPWSMEAREHLQRLTPEVPFLQVIERDFPRLATEAAAVHALARHNVQAARERGEMEILGRWGEGVKRGTGNATGYLNIARELGVELTRSNGDRMLERAVAAIDRADEAKRNRLAAAHADYAAGLKAFQDSQPVNAEPLLRRAAAAFGNEGSPMQLLARFFAANTAFEQGRHEEARRELEALLAAAPAADRDGYRAQLLWQLGVCRAVRAEWGESVRLLAEASAILEELGELQNAATVRRILAVIYDRAGDSSTAWKHRMVALRGAGVRSDLALEKAVATIAHAAVFRRKWQTAASFLNLEIEIARRTGDEVQLADALLVRATVRNRMHDDAGARADLADSNAASGRARDASYRDYGRAAQSFVRAMLTASPVEATQFLTEAIAFESTKGDRVNLPGLFLQRGRARRRAGDPAGAADDFRRGMDELEAHRQSLPQGAARWGVFYAADELFEEAIDLALHESDDAGAFAVAERARARSLLDSYGRSPSSDHGSMPPGTAVVEYAALPSRLVIFVSDASGVEAFSIACDREVLAAEVNALAPAFSATDLAASRRAGVALYRRLIQPVASRLLSAATVVFVPDAVTSAVPFSALIDGEGDYLLERHAVVIAPSAAVFQAASERRRNAHAPRSVLVVANAEEGAGGGRLNFVRAEGERVSRAYATSIILQDEDARFDLLAQRAVDADVVHFAGHAIGDESGFVPASIVLRQDGRERRIESAEIAQLRLPRTSVVVLAGCSTARGERRGMEGVISVAHGFLTAGAPSVIATLWPIDDGAAADLFPSLHRLLAEGRPPAEALREVQLESIRRGDVPPSLWAALQDIGS